MDSGEIEVFNAYRVQHNNSRGPFKVVTGGTRGRGDRAAEGGVKGATHGQRREWQGQWGGGCC